MVPSLMMIKSFWSYCMDKLLRNQASTCFVLMNASCVPVWDVFVDLKFCVPVQILKFYLGLNLQKLVFLTLCYACTGWARILSRSTLLLFDFYLDHIWSDQCVQTGYYIVYVIGVSRIEPRGMIGYAFIDLMICKMNNYNYYNYYINNAPQCYYHFVVRW